MTTIYDFTVNDLDGKPVSLSMYSGSALLIVNVASKCGFTPQYKDLEELHRTYSPRGFSVLGFPCNQFGGQEPGDAQEIRTFCSLTYDVTFPLFEKIDVNGAHAHPLFTYLKSTAPGILGTEGIKWNFTKFLIDKTGVTRDRFAPQTKGKDLSDAIELLL